MKKKLYYNLSPLIKIILQQFRHCLEHLKSPKRNQQLPEEKSLTYVHEPWFKFFSSQVIRRLRKILIREESLEHNIMQHVGNSKHNQKHCRKRV